MASSKALDTKKTETKTARKPAKKVQKKERSAWRIKQDEKDQRAIEACVATIKEIVGEKRAALFQVISVKGTRWGIRLKGTEELFAGPLHPPVLSKWLRENAKTIKSVMAKHK